MRAVRKGRAFDQHQGNQNWLIKDGIMIDDAGVNVVVKDVLVDVVMASTYHCLMVIEV